MNVLIVIDKILNHYDNMRPLLEEHVNELTTYKNIMKLSPDLKTYKMLDDADSGYGVFAYLDDKLIGYSVNIVSNHLHYSELIYTTNDILFVNKEYRNKGIGNMIMDSAEQEALKRGSKLFLQHAKPDTALFQLLKDDPKYRVQDITFSKVL